MKAADTELYKLFKVIDVMHKALWNIANGYVKDPVTIAQKAIDKTNKMALKK